MAISDYIHNLYGRHLQRFSNEDLTPLLGTHKIIPSFLGNLSYFPHGTKNLSTKTTVAEEVADAKRPTIFRFYHSAAA